MIKVIRDSKDSEILVVTPLLPNHKISKETKKTIKRNDVPFTWISSEGNFNIPTNAQNGIDWYKRNHPLPLPPYYIMVDRDIVMGRHMLDRLYRILKSSPSQFGYTYASFEFKGAVNQKFPAQPFDINKLVRANYISSNSLFKMSVIEEVGLVTDDQYKRLLDWAFLLKCFYHGYVGVPVDNARFIAMSAKGDISAGSPEDYQIKRNRVLNDFIKPIFEKHQPQQGPAKPTFF
jgi:hypothetical protein